MQPPMQPMSRPPEPLRAVIADDEPLARRKLRALLAEQPDITVVAETANGPETIDVVRAHGPDVLFLDVHMPGADGIEVLEALGPDRTGVVVLVTAFDDYAIAAFEHHALDYVLKPVDHDRFRATVERVRVRLRQQRAARITEETLRALAQIYRPASSADAERYLARIVVRSGQKTSIVDVAAIDWVDVRGDYLALHTDAGVHLSRGTLGALERRLDPAEFVRIHRSTLVRLSRVKELEPYFHGDFAVTLHDGTRLRLSRTYRAHVQNVLGQSL
jgi:two-component system, LytTR family, response regulator